MNRITLAMSAIALLASLVIPSSGALAQFATDVQCAQCVGTGDIAFGAVREGRIADGAVTNRKIAFGAVREARIADGAVTNRKIAPGAVREGRIANRAVTTPKIALGAVVEGRLANGAVATNKIRDGAVTTAKIADGSVTVAKLASGPSSTFARIILIQGDGTDLANCTALTDALAAIVDNSTTTRYLIKLEPGIYDCGTTVINMKPYVDIEGSGMRLTKVTGTVNDSSTALLFGASNSELRYLTVENVDSASTVTSIRANSANPFSMLHVQALATNNGSSVGAMTAVYINGGTAELHGIFAQAEGCACGSSSAAGVVVVGGATLTMLNSTSTATVGIFKRGISVFQASDVEIRNSELVATAGGIHIDATSGASTVKVASSLVDFNAVLLGGAAVGDIDCVGAFDANYVAHDTNCQ